MEGTKNLFQYETCTFLHCRRRYAKRLNVKFDCHRMILIKGLSSHAYKQNNNCCWRCFGKKKMLKRKSVNFVNEILLFFSLLSFRMNTIWIAFASLAYASIIIDANAIVPPTEKTIIRKTQCEPGDAFRMFGYDCSNMDLKEVPQNLRSSVKVN